MINDTFQLSLPTKKILEYKLAICRDYAKLTASLLLNVYPDSEIYFFTIPRHVAAGIKINNKIYILDQHLPVLTIEKWLMTWNKKKANILVGRLISSERDKIKIKKSEPVKLSLWKIPEVNVEKLTDEIVRYLKLKQI